MLFGDFSRFADFLFYRFANFSSSWSLSLCKWSVMCHFRSYQLVNVGYDQRQHTDARDRTCSFFFQWTVIISSFLLSIFFRDITSFQWEKKIKNITFVYISFLCVVCVYETNSVLKFSAAPLIIWLFYDIVIGKQ